jgi:hypothetical protein
MDEFRDFCDQITGLHNLSLRDNHISFFINPISVAFFIKPETYRGIENTRCCHEKTILYFSYLHQDMSTFVPSPSSLARSTIRLAVMTS